MDQNETLLIGKWQPIEDCFLNNGNWCFYSEYEVGKSYYIFDGRYFTTHASDYFRDGIIHPYIYKPDTQSILLEEEVIKLVHVSDTHLSFDISIGLPNDNDTIRILLRRCPEE